MSGAGFQVLCQVCGAPNPPEARICGRCHANLEIAFHEREAMRLKEVALDALPPEVRAQAEELEDKIAGGETRPAPFVQLSALYQTYKIKDRAVAILEQAVEANPGNPYLQQKLDLLIHPQLPDLERRAQIEASDERVRRGMWIAYVVFALAAVAALYLVVTRLLFPSNYRVADTLKVNTVSVRFAPDGDRLAYLEVPKYGITDLMPGLGEDLTKTDSKLVVAGLRGQDKKAVAEFASFGMMWGPGLEFHWIPGQNRIALVEWEDRESAIVAVDLETGARQKLAAGSEPTFSGDGRYMAYLAPPPREEPAFGAQGLETAPPAFFRWFFFDDDLSLYVLNMASGESRRVMDEVKAPHFSPVAHEIVYQKTESAELDEPYYDPRSGQTWEEYWESRFPRVVADADIYKYNVDTGVETALTRDRLSESPRFTPDGASVVYKSYEKPDDYRNALMIMNTDGSGKRRLLSQAPAYESFGRVAFSHDGKMVAFEGQFVNPDRPTTSVQVTPFGTFGGERNVKTDIFLMRSDGTHLRRLTATKHKFKSNPSFHPDSYRLAYEIVYIDLRREAWIAKVKP